MPSWADGYKRMSLKQESSSALQNSLLLGWCLACLAWLLFCIPRLEAAAVEELLVCWQALLPVCFMLWLWAINVRTFEGMDLPYDLCFSASERRYLIPATDIMQVALWVTGLAASGAAAFCYAAMHHWHAAGEYAVVVTYASLVALLLLPLGSLMGPTRLFFAATLRRVLLPLQEVTWSDFLLADILTSLSKSTGDLAKAACFVGQGMRSSLRSHKAACDPVGLPVLCALCLPYAIRLVQCLRVHRATRNPAQLFNALKYATSFPALVLTALEHEAHVRGQPFPLRTLWLLSMAVNTLYSYYWDLEMDWDMPWLVQPGAVKWGLLRLPALKRDAAFRPRWYAWAAASNLALRLTWAHRLLGDLENLGAVALGMSLLEAFRRHQWAYVRVETEVRKLRVSAAHDHALQGMPLHVEY